MVNKIAPWHGTSTSRARSTPTGASGSPTGAKRGGPRRRASRSPVTDHGASDDVGVAILGEESDGFWKDHKGAGVNAIRTQTLIRQADVVVVRFGDQYKQWNAAFDAGFAAALGKPIVTLHDPDTTHALKEIDRAAMATAETPEQVVDVLRYVLDGKLPAGSA